MNNSYTWVPVFKKIAWKLLDFKNDHKKLLDIMYEILEEINQFDDAKEKNCNLDKFNGIRCKYDDFDPFSFMNRLALYSGENRKDFIRKFQEKTGMEIEIPSDFDGVPTVNPMLSCMIRFKDDREENDVDDLWNFFEIALHYSEDNSYEELFIKHYDIVLAKPNCRYNISSCLFRLNPEFYISLDSTNRKFIEDKIGLKIKREPSGQEYIDIINSVKKYIENSNEYTSIMDFSYNAWIEKKKKTKRKVWLYQPGEQATYWQDCIDNQIMVIGWDKLGDLTNCNDYDYIYEQIKINYNEENPKNAKCAIGDFVNEINIGDIVIVKKGLNKLLGYGEVTSDYYFDIKFIIIKNYLEQLEGYSDEMHKYSFIDSKNDINNSENNTLD